MGVNNQHIHWMLAQCTPADSQLPMKIYHFLLKPHRQASFRHAGLPRSPLMHRLCQDTDSMSPPIAQTALWEEVFRKFSGFWLHLMVTRKTLILLGSAGKQQQLIGGRVICEQMVHLSLKYFSV